MRYMKQFLPPAAVLLVCLGIPAGSPAQAPGDAPQRVEQARAVLACADSMDVIASTMEFKPGESLDVHLHHGVEAVYVIQGAKVLMGGRDTVEMQAGRAMLNLRDMKHAGFRVVGDTPLKLFTVHVVDRGTPLYDYVK